MSVGKRLKEERSRLGLGQVAFAQACNVSRSTQTYFEADTNVPGGAYLIAADALGVDVLYVLTGRRSRPVDMKEAALLDNYRALDDDGKAQLDAAGIAGKKPGAVARASSKKRAG